MDTTERANKEKELKTCIKEDGSINEELAKELETNVSKLCEELYKKDSLGMMNKYLVPRLNGDGILTAKTLPGDKYEFYGNVYGPEELQRLPLNQVIYKYANGLSTLNKLSEAEDIAISAKYNIFAMERTEEEAAKAVTEYFGETFESVETLIEGVRKKIRQDPHYIKELEELESVLLKQLNRDREIADSEE